MVHNLILRLVLQNRVTVSLNCAMVLALMS